MLWNIYRNKARKPGLGLLYEIVSNCVYTAICESCVHELILTQSVGRVPLEQSPEQRLGLRTQELRHSQTRPAGRDDTQLKLFHQISSVWKNLQYVTTDLRVFFDPEDTHFKIRFIVSLRSFPWNGSDPVNISNWRREYLAHLYVHNAIECVSLAMIIFPPYHQYSKWPPVGTVGVSLPVHNLWCHVLHSTTEGISLLLMINGFFTQAKICKTHHMTQSINYLIVS